MNIFTSNSVSLYIGDTKTTEGKKLCIKRSNISFDILIDSIITVLSKNYTVLDIITHSKEYAIIIRLELNNTKLNSAHLTKLSILIDNFLNQKSVTSNINNPINPSLIKKRGRPRKLLNV